MGLFCICCLRDRFSVQLIPPHAGLRDDSSKRSNGPCAHFCFLGLRFCKTYRTEANLGLKHGIQTRNFGTTG